MFVKSVLFPGFSANLVLIGFSACVFFYCCSCIDNVILNMVYKVYHVDSDYGFYVFVGIQATI